MQAGQSSISMIFPASKPSLSKHIQATIGWFFELGELLRWLDLAQNRLEGMTGGFSFGAQLEVLNLFFQPIGGVVAWNLSDSRILRGLVVDLGSG